MLGVYTVILAKKHMKDEINDIYHDSVKYGFLNKVAEYGGVSIHIKIREHSFCFTNVHLPFGRI